MLVHTFVVRLTWHWRHFPQQNKKQTNKKSPNTQTSRNISSETVINGGHLLLHCVFRTIYVLTDFLHYFFWHLSHKLNWYGEEMFLTSPQQRRRQAGSAKSSVQRRMLFQITWSFLDKAMKGACEGTLINFTQSCCPTFVTWQSLTNPVLQ